MIHLRLPTPPSANRYWRTTRAGRRPYLSEEAKAYKVAVRAVARSCGLPGPFLGKVAVSFLWTRAIRSGDLDNRKKVLFDALQGIAYVNDSQIVEIHAWMRDRDMGTPGVMVQVSEALTVCPFG